MSAPSQYHSVSFRVADGLLGQRVGGRRTPETPREARPAPVMSTNSRQGDSRTVPFPAADWTFGVAEVVVAAACAPGHVQFLIAMLACALSERMARKAKYLREENRVLKAALQAATGKSRVPLTKEQQRRLAAKGKALTPTEREECGQIERPSTILA